MKNTKIYTSEDVIDTIDCSNTSETKEEQLALLITLVAQVLELKQKEELSRKTFWDKNDIMEATGFSAKTVDEILSDPELNVNTLGKARLVARTDFIEYFKKNRNRTCSAYWRRTDKLNKKKRA